jgi:hypothetical protein
MHGLVDGLIEGDRLSWAVVGGIWLAAAIAAFTLRARAATPTRALILAAIASALVVVAAPLASALSLPHLRWANADEPTLVATTGETWRKLRGPAALVLVGGAPEIAIPTVDAQERWILYGLLGKKPIEGLEPAPPAPPEPGAARLCRNEGEGCRAWPATWPDPTKAPALAELEWQREPGGAALAFSALAYDQDTQLFLHSAGKKGQGALEIIGRLSNDPARDSASALFVVRAVANGHLRAVRILAAPAPAAEADAPAANKAAPAGPPGYAFHLQRAEASLLLAPAIHRYLVLPILLLAALMLPFALLAFALAPKRFAAALSKQGAVRRELPRPMLLLPAGDSKSATRPATVADDVDLGDALLPANTVIALADGGRTTAPVASRAWLELPEDAAVQADSEPGPRKIGRLIPADPRLFVAAARSWVAPRIASTATLALGLAAALPAALALASLWSSR